MACRPYTRFPSVLSTLSVGRRHQHQRRTTLTMAEATLLHTGNPIDGTLVMREYSEHALVTERRSALSYGRTHVRGSGELEIEE